MKTLRIRHLWANSAVALLAAVLAACGSSKSCPAGQTLCNGNCVDTQNDPLNCGGCMSPQTVCAVGASCQAGKCVCPTGQIVCNGACTDPQTDAKNCGGCGVQCGDLGTCSAGGCSCTSPAIACTGATPVCVDTTSDPKHCGDCATVCPTHGVCTSSACVCPSTLPDRCPPPPASTTLCTDLGKDTSNCGTCGTVCPQNEVCQTGTPVSASICVCPKSFKLCLLAGGEACVDPQTDVNNCGDCGVQCATGQTCSGSACHCPTGKTLCNGVCVDTTTDRKNCGTCGYVCSGTTPCTGSVCCATAVCGGACCQGGTACCSDGTCPLAHSNGLGQFYFDCAPLGTLYDATTYTQNMANEAARAWAPNGTSRSALSGCLAWQNGTGGACAVWCWGSYLPGLVHLDTSGAGCVQPTSSTEANTFIWN